MIECRNITVSYIQDRDTVFHAIKDISLEIGDAEFIAVVGPNGSGKSSLALALAGLLPLKSGSIVIDRVSMNELKDSRTLYDKIGIVFQNPDDQLVTNLVDTEIAFGLENRSVPQAEIIRRVNEILERFQLKDLTDRPPHQLSGGEKQLLALASVLVSNPKYLILDESTSFLDSFSRKMVLNQLHKEFKIRRSEGFTVILITQFSREAVHCGRVIVLNNGKLCVDDVPDKVFTEHQELLHTIGVEIPVEYRFKQECPDIPLPQSLFD